MYLNNLSRHIPEQWHRLDIESWPSQIVLIGASDSGKTTFARYCCQRLLSQYDKVGYVDMDVGQNTFGLPTTAGFGMAAEGQCESFPPEGLRRHVFVGSVSPVGHEVRVLVALGRLCRFAVDEGAGAIVVDTSGFVDAAHGAADLKWAQVELLRPCTVVALQREEELVPIIEPLAHLDGVLLTVLPVSEHVSTRSRETRRAYRADCYRRYFAGAARMPLRFRDLAIFARGVWCRHQLVALEDAGGFVRTLATIEGVSEAVVWLRTPLPPDVDVAALRFGDVWLSPDTFEDHYVS